MKNKIKLFLENKIVDGFLIGLILLNFIVFIFQTDINFYNKFALLIGVIGAAFIDVTKKQD